MREKDIRKKYGKHITGIDHIFISCNKMVLVQDKWMKTKPTIRDINHFVRCSKQIELINYNYVCLPIFVSKLVPTQVALKSLLEDNGLSIYNSDMDKIIKALENIVLEFFGLDLDGDIIMK